MYSRLDEIKDLVAWDNGYINWDNLENKRGSLTLLEFNFIIEEIVRIIKEERCDCE